MTNEPAVEPIVTKDPETGAQSVVINAPVAKAAAKAVPISEGENK